MKIVQMFYYPGQGGAEKYALLLAQSAREDGHELIFLFGRNGPMIDQVQNSGFQFRYLKMRHPFDFKAVWDLAKFLKKERPDIIHTHFLRENFIAVFASRIVRGPKIINTIHRIEPKTFLQKKANLIMSRGVHHFIAVSRVAQKYLEEEGIKPKKITVVYNGTELTKVVRKKISADTREPIVGYAGRLSEEKNVLLLLQALALLRERYPFRLEIVGDGPEKEMLLEEAERLEFRDRISFLGFQKDPSKFYQKWDIFVLPSRIEVFPIVILEAMASGVPVIAAQVGGVPEIITEGENGLLFESNNADALANKLEILFQSRSLRNNLIKNGYESVSCFSVEKMWAQTAKIYS